MGWKIWIVLVIFGIGFLGNLKDLWSPKEHYRDEDESRKAALLSLLFQVFIVYAILDAVSSS